MIALGNSSNQSIHATLIFSNGGSREVNVAPFSTEIVRRHSEDSGQSDDDGATGVSINYSGPQGSLIPTGFVSSANGRFTSNIRFYNTPNVVQPNLYANNLRLKDTVPHMVLRNTSPDFLTARPRFLTAAGTPSGMVKLPTLRLKPNEIVEVDLRPLMVATQSRTDLDSVSVQVLNSGAPGSLIGALYSQDRRTGVTYDVPLRDSGSPRTSTGAYPVRVDGDYTTVLSITNVTDKPGDFTLQVNYDGGTYELGLVTANPGETKNFDIRKLRDEQTPDRNGRPFPRDLGTGQIRWSMRGNGSVPLFGRSEVVSLREGVSSSYSCPTCCPSTFYDGWLDPGYSSIFEGDSQQLLGQERQRDCYGNIYGPYETSWGFWYGANPDIATMNGNGQATGISEGTAGFSFTWTTYYWMMDFDEQCIPFESSNTGSSSMDVAPDPNRKIISITQQILNESSQGQEVVECGNFRVIVRYQVGCPPPNHTLDLIGHIQDDAILQTSATELINNQSDELCTYELNALYKMKNRLSQTIGTGFTSYTARLTWNGKSVTKAGPGISTRATISGTGPCP